MKIQQVAEQTGLSIHALRYYEQMGLIIPVIREQNGHRDYSEDDVARIIFVMRLRSAGMPITNIRRYAELAQQGEETSIGRLEILEEHRVCVEEKIQELCQYLEIINNKIKHYRDCYIQEMESKVSQG
jgi:DNA-binding transcriptional MerR regulator